MTAKAKPNESEKRLSREQIVKLAGDRAFARALAYQGQGRVEGVLRSSSTVVATVRGTVPYRVKLTLGATLEWVCNCPVGVEGKFCKHCAAVAIELLDPGERTIGRSLPGDSGPAMAERLDELSREQLEEIVRLAAARDPRVAQAIETAAVAAGDEPLDVAQWQKRIDTAFRTGGFVPYAEAPGWEAGISEVLDALGDLIAAGYPAEVLDLVERAHRKLERSMQRVDDSGGEVVRLSDDIADIHLKAALAAAPEPAALAKRLAKLELGCELDTFRRAALTYREVLGDKGIREYRKAVEGKWRKAVESQQEPWRHDRLAATEAMIGVVLAGGNPDELVEVMSDRLRTPDGYLEIARAMEKAGRRGEAIRWARRGLDSVGTRYWSTRELREFLASLYVADGVDDAAEEVWWDDFKARPSVESYRRLLAETRTCDPADVSHRAIKELRSQAEAKSGSVVHWSVLVAVLLYEGRVEDAWEVGKGQELTEETWMKLAKARESQHPLEAIPIYERVAAARVETKKAAGYRDAVKLLKRIETLAAAGGEPLVFVDVIGRFVEEHARKPSFMGLLQRQGWT